MSNDDKITGKIIVTGELECRSPLLISSGEGTDVDLDVVRDGEGKPFVPGTSWMGAVRDYFEFLESKDEKLFRSYFGYVKPNSKSKNPEFQSAIIPQDLEMIGKADIEPRTNTAIDSITLTAKKDDKGRGSLFNYETLASGNKFNFGFEVTVRKLHDFDEVKKLTATIISEMKNGNITLGSKTNAGFGRVQLNNVKWTVFKFPNDDEKWLTGDKSATDEVDFLNIIEIKNNITKITGKFKLDGSIMVRKKAGVDEYDTEQMTSNGKPIIPGTSLKGVIRHRAKKILRTLDKYNESKFHKLFGFVDNETKGNTDDAIKGRISVNECIINGGVSEVQTRIRVDYFTGGVMDHALFSEKPIWSDENTFIEVDIRLNDANDFESALIIQVLKDLWTGWLTIGGESSIGRGRFKGEQLTIERNNQSAKILQDGENLKISDGDGLLKSFEDAWKNKEVTNVSV